MAEAKRAVTAERVMVIGAEWNQTGGMGVRARAGFSRSREPKLVLENGAT